MHGEELVVGFRSDQRARGSQQVDANHGGENAADEEEECDGNEIQKGDALVVGGEQPRTNAVTGVEIVIAWHLISR